MVLRDAAVASRKSRYDIFERPSSSAIDSNGDISDNDLEDDEEPGGDDDGVLGNDEEDAAASKNGEGNDDNAENSQ